MSEGKFKQICQSLKFFDLHLCFPILDFYSKSQSFNNQPKEFHEKLIQLKEDILFNRTQLFEQQQKFAQENKSSLYSVETLEEEK